MKFRFYSRQNRRILTILAAGLGSLIGASSQGMATPQLISQCNAPTIPEGASVYYHSEDCDTIYVGPPRQGTIEVDRYHVAALPVQCSILKTTLTYYESLINSFLTELNAANVDGPDQGQQCRRLTAELARASSQLAASESQITTVMNQLVELARTSEADANSSQTDHLLLSARLQAELSAHRAEKNRSTRRVATLESDFFKHSCDALATAPSTGQGNRETSDFTRILNEYTTFLSNQARIPGSTAVIGIELPYADLIERWRLQNQSKNIVPLPTQMRMAAGTKLTDDTGLTGIWAANLVGIADEDGNILFGNAIAAEIVLNLPATCKAEESRASNALEDAIGQGTMALSAVVEYPVFVGTQYSVSVDFNELYSRIRKETSKGGFFSTSRAVSVTDMRRSDEVITIEFSTTDIDEDLRDYVIRSVKESTIQRALNLINAEYVAANDLTATLARRETTGAQASAKALRENCANPWCQAGAAIIDVAHAVFGSEKERSDFLKTKNISVSEQFSSVRPITQYTSIRF